MAGATSVSDDDDSTLGCLTITTEACIADDIINELKSLNTSGGAACQEIPNFNNLYLYTVENSSLATAACASAAVNNPSVAGLSISSFTGSSPYSSSVASSEVHTPVDTAIGCTADSSSYH